MALIGFNASSKVAYLNNNVETDGNQNLFKTFNEAYTFCSPGDTIYVLGSVESYGAVNVSKKITLIGPGYFLNENMNTQVDKKAAIFDNIKLGLGSEGTKIIGISASGFGSDIYIYADNITLLNSFISNRIYLGRASGHINLNNINIQGCYFNTHGSNVDYSFFHGIFENFVFTNNILNGTFGTPSGSTGIISNNLFLHDYFQPGSASSFEIKNNILMCDDATQVVMQSIPNISVSNNISALSIFGTENGNLAFKTANSMFLGATGNSTDGQYQLLNSGSNPAMGAANDGGNIGPFGGSSPYRLSGLPSLPNIYELSTGGFVSGDKLNVHIKIKQ
jgi:hypothetical protein